MTRLYDSNSDLEGLQPASPDQMFKSGLSPQKNGSGAGAANSINPAAPLCASGPDNPSQPVLSGVSESDKASSQSQLLSPPETAPSQTKAEADEENFGFLPVLQNRNFLMLWSGQVFSQLADKVYLVLMIALITSRYQAAGQTVSGWVSTIMVAFTIPAVLFGSVAGVFVDRWAKKQVLVATNLLRGGLVLMLPLLLWISQDWRGIGGIPAGFYILLGATFLVSTLTQFFAPAEQAAIPLIVRRDFLLPANSLYTLTMMAAVIVGFAVGEPLLEVANALVNQLGFQIEFGRELIVGACYAIAGVLLLFLRTGEQAANQERQQPHVWQDIRDGLRYLGEQKQVRGALIQLVTLFSVFAALAVLVVRMAEIIPEIKASQFGFLLAAGGLGMALSLLVLNRLKQRFTYHQLSFYGSMGMALSLAGLALLHHRLWPTLILLVCLGACAAVVGVPMQTIIQEKTPEELRGKVFGLQNNAINIALSLPLALAGVAETFWGLKVVLLGLAVIVVTGGLLTWYIADTGSS